MEKVCFRKRALIPVSRSSSVGGEAKQKNCFASPTKDIFLEELSVKTLQGMLTPRVRKVLKVSSRAFVAIISLGILGTLWYFGHVDVIRVSADAKVLGLEQENRSEFAREDFVQSVAKPPLQRSPINVAPKGVMEHAEYGSHRLASPDEALEQGRRAKMWMVVDSLGYPSAEDQKWLGTDSRNKAVREMIGDAEAKLERLLSEETKAFLLQSAQRMWFRMERLVDMYNSGGISYAEYNDGLARISILNAQEEAGILSDEEFAAYNGEKKSESVLLTSPSSYDPSILLDTTKRGVQSTPNLPEKDVEFFALFSGVQRDHPEIQTLKDLNAHVSEASIDAMNVVAKEFIRTENELRKALQNGSITEAAYKASLKEARQKAKQDTLASLIDTEREYLFGGNK